MKELKFRVWNNRTKAFLSKEYLKKHEVCISCVDNLIIQNILYSKDIIGKEIFVQQYIGIKDRNGVEVYEGDIISFKPKSEQPPFYVVKYDLNRACFLPYNHKREYFLEDDEDFPVFLYSDEIRILGNVFETPELLK